MLGEEFPVLKQAAVGSAVRDDVASRWTLKVRAPRTTTETPMGFGPLLRV